MSSDFVPPRHPSSRRQRNAADSRVPTRPLAISSAVLDGLLAGGMVVIEVVLLPFWRGSPPADFRRWFAAHVGRIRALMVPLGAAAGAACAASAAAQWVEGRRTVPAAMAAAAATAGVIAITVTVNEPANHRFTGGTLTDTETTDLLTTWARWHHVRVLLGVVATVAAAAAITERDA
jgi:anthrone oxygenase-like protein